MTAALTTPAEVRAFQAHPAHRDPFGYHLKADGILGPVTRWAYAFTLQALGRRAIIHRAWESYGLVETGPNTDAAGRIPAWLKAANARVGDPWCAAWASDCVGGRKIASAVALGSSYPEIPPTQARLADLVWFRTDERGHGHVELLLGIDLPANLAMTIGGNVANGVRLSLRPVDRVRFARTIGASSPSSAIGIIRHSDVPLRVPSYADTR